MNNLRNIQIIDAAINATFDIYQTSEDDFFLIFAEEGQDIEFDDDFVSRVGEQRAQEVFDRLWKNRVKKPLVQGIHGTIIFGDSERKPYFPTKKWDEMRNVF